MCRAVPETGTRIGAGPVLHGQRRILLVASRWWQLEFRCRANVEYQPRGQPRFLCFRRPADLPVISFAAGRAGGFLP